MKKIFTLIAVISFLLSPLTSKASFLGLATTGDLAQYQSQINAIKDQVNQLQVEVDNLQPKLGAAAIVYKPIPRYESSLAVAIDNVSTSSLTLSSGIDNDGNALSGPMCFTVDSGVGSPSTPTTQAAVEDICGVASGTVVSNLVRGVDSSGVTSNPNDAHPHRVGADVKVTDSPYLGQYYRLLNGADSFPNPLQYSASNTPQSLGLNPQNFASVGYVNSTTNQGAATMSNTVAGIGLLANTTQLKTGVSASGSYPYVVPSSAVNQTATPNSLCLTNSSGTIDPNCVPTSTVAFSNATSGAAMTDASGHLTSAVQPGASGNVLQSNGSSWASLPLSLPTKVASTAASNYSGTVATTTFIGANLPIASTGTTYYISATMSANTGFNSPIVYVVASSSVASTTILQCTEAGGSIANFTLNGTISMLASTSSELVNLTGFQNGTTTPCMTPASLGTSFSLDLSTTTQLQLRLSDGGTSISTKNAMTIIAF
jgi:hypothetical protein